jgi:hypothetical protein
MNATVNAKEIKTNKEVREYLQLQIAQYVEQQPESKQAFHKWMKRLEAVGVGVILVAFSTALYISIAWKSVDPIVIPIAWFGFAASASPLFMLVGLHTIVLKAFPPIVLPGSKQKFVTGGGAVWPGWGYVVLALALVAFWGFFAYAVATQNWALLTPLIGFLGIAMSVMIVVGMLLATIQKLTKSR